ncbi:MAG: DotG/IcmE/VirB10 family protein [Alphaproteobacteria bacterium]|nr:DotG/IcmE/VirB10 family protein [Alphaproteobacteria bacterium]MBV8549317.1 DotG/IcmE/VirB10 family protein [Alphaproteobacteria bacterium]
MTNNFDDFEGNEHLGEEPTAVPAKKGLVESLGHAWRSQPVFKLFVLMVAVGAVAAVSISLMSGDRKTQSSANVIKPPDLNEAPGGKSSPYMKEQTELANKQRVAEAIKSGGSAVPTPVGATGGPGDALGGTKEDDMLNELKAEIASMNKQIQDTKRAAPPPITSVAVQGVPQQGQPGQPERFDDSLAQAMQRQMSQLMDSWTVHGIKSVTVSKSGHGDGGGDEIVDANASGTGVSTVRHNPTETSAGSSAAGGSSVGNSQARTIVPAGTVSYAQLLTEANSDVPGPIMVQIVSGPLAGARAIGSFEVANGNADYLVLDFKLANYKGHDYRLNAIALDPDTTLGGMATEVDQRYFMRVVLPAASGFLQGFASALGQGDSNTTISGTTTIVQQSSKGYKQGLYSGLGGAAQTAGQFFQNQANQTRPLVRVAAGTPLGLFFVDTVAEDSYYQSDAQIAADCAKQGMAVGQITANQTGCVQKTTSINGIPGFGGVNGLAGNPYAQLNGLAGGGVPTTGAGAVPYPNYATSGQTGVTNPLALSGGTTAYPGSTIYYTH